MPIIIEDPFAGGGFGPGFQVAVRTDFVGPIPNSRWLIENFGPPGSEAVREQGFVPVDPHVTARATFLGDTAVTLPLSPWLDGQTTDLRVTLFSNDQVFEQTTIPVVNQETVGRVFQLHSSIGGTGGALTPEQATQLEETHASTFPSVLLDDMLLRELTDGPQGGVVSENLITWVWGVIVRIAEVPPEFRVNTADGDYWQRSLAVVRIYRSSDLWKRVPVHTSSKLIDFTEEGLVSAVTAQLPLQWLLQMSVQVSFAEGVTGQVFLIKPP